MRASLCLIVFGLILVSPTVANAQGDEGLNRLRCVRLDVVTTNPTLSQALSREELRQVVLVTIRAKLPRLTVAENCADRLRFWYHVNDISGARLDGFYGHLEIGLMRPVLLLETRRNITAETWTSGTAYFHGPKSIVREKTLENIDRSITEFAAKYYEAGNP